MLEMLTQFEMLAYILAGLLFILALAGLSQQKTANRGNKSGICGMALALVAVIVVTLAGNAEIAAQTAGLMVVGIAIGAAIGVWRAVKVQMTEMPQLVAMLHQFVGLAAVLVGFNSFFIEPGGHFECAMNAYHLGEVGLAIFIGAVTFTGSIVAFLKLSAKISGKPLMIPGRNAINAIMVLVCLACIGWLIHHGGLARPRSSSGACHRWR